MGCTTLRAKEYASTRELVDSEGALLRAHWETKKTSLTELGTVSTAATFNSRCRIHDNKSDSLRGEF